MIIEYYERLVTASRVGTFLLSHLLHHIYEKCSRKQACYTAQTIIEHRVFPNYPVIIQQTHGGRQISPARDNARRPISTKLLTKL